MWSHSHDVSKHQSWHVGAGGEGGTAGGEGGGDEGVVGGGGDGAEIVTV